MTRQIETGEGPPSLVFFRSTEEEAQTLLLLRDYLSRHSLPRIRQLLSMELLNMAGNDIDPLTRHHS